MFVLNSTRHHLLILIALGNLVLVGCEPTPPVPPKPPELTDPPTLPKPPGGETNNGGPSTSPGVLSVLTREWNAEQDVSWELSELLGELSDAAYLEATAAREAFQKMGFSDVKQHKVDSTVGYVITEGPLTVVAFRGTDDVGDWFVNLKVSTAKVDGGEMHAGFYEAYQLVARDIQADVQAAKPKVLWITGHSLRCALAVVCAHQLHQQQIPINGVVTFGQPMVAKANLVTHLNSILPQKYARFINAADIVPRVPPLFEHAGCFVWFQDDGFTHAKAGAAEKRSGDPGLATQLPQEPPPLSEDEFKKLQEQFGNQRVPAGGPQQMKALRLPFLDDHAMLEYLTRLELRGEPSSDRKAGPQLPTGPELPAKPDLPTKSEQPAKPELPKFPPRGGPPELPRPRIP